MKKVLIMEDEVNIRNFVVINLKRAGYDAIEAGNGQEALDAIAMNADVGVAILDIMVPGVDGFEGLKYIQANCPYTAVIMLTALEDEQTQVKAFNLYADDYVIKPVSPIILLKRMETILRRTTKQQSLEQETEKGLILKEESYCAFFEGKQLPLTLSEYLLLQKLYKEPNRVFTREQLILSIFNEDYIGNDRIIDAHVKNLRKKLPVSCIKTVIGVGYQFDKESLT